MKFHLFQIVPNKKVKFLFLSFALCFGLFLPLKPAQAIFGVADIGLFDLFMMQLDALDFGEGVVLQFIFFLALLLVVSQAFLLLSAKLFQWAIEFPINLGITSANPMVTSGWQFTSGLVNTFLILIFVIIALAYILRIETLGAKKALPRLIIVAILINFSLVFIAIGVDITQIILKSITSSLGSDLPRLAIDPLAKSLSNLLWGYCIVILSAYLAFALVPGLNVIGLFALIGSFIAEAAWGTISLSILLIILGFGMGSVFFLYFILFMIRVGMIWMLAILSPLAFAAAILPNTQKYWKQWLGLLLEWLFFGIIVLLLAGLGLKLFAENEVIPNTGPISVGPLRLFPSFTYNYLFLLIYLGLVFYYSKKKFAPELASVLISQGTGLVKRATPIGAAAQVGLARWLVKREEEQRKLEIARAKPEGLGFREKIGAGLFRATGVLARPARLGYRYIARTTPEVVVSKDVARRETELTSRFGKDYVSAASMYPTLGPAGKVALGLYLQKTKGAKGLGELSQEQLRQVIRLTAEHASPRLGDLIKHVSEFIDETTARERGVLEADVRKITDPEKRAKLFEKNITIAKLIQKAMVPKGLNDNDVKKLIDLGIKEADTIRKAAFKKAVDALGAGDVENLALSTLENPEFQEMVVRFKPSNFIRVIGEEKGTEYIETLRDKARALKASEIAKTNLTLLRQSVLNPGFRAIFEPLEGAKTPEEIEKLGAEMREELRKEREAREVVAPPEEETPRTGGRLGPTGQPSTEERRPPGGRGRP